MLNFEFPQRGHSVIVLPSHHIVQPVFDRRRPPSSTNGILPPSSTYSVLPPSLTNRVPPSTNGVLPSSTNGVLSPLKNGVPHPSSTNGAFLEEQRPTSLIDEWLTPPSTNGSLHRRTAPSLDKQPPRTRRTAPLSTHSLNKRLQGLTHSTNGFLP